MQFGGGGGFYGGNAASAVHATPKRSFKRGGQMNLNLTPQQMSGGGGMQVNGMQAVVSPSHARFFNYAQFVQAKAGADGEGDDAGAKADKKKKKKNRDK